MAYTPREPEKEEVQPVYTGAPPTAITSTRRKEGVLYVAGEGSKTAKVMFVGPSAFPDDTMESKKTNGGTREYTVKPRYMTSTYGSVLKSVLNGVGLDFYKECYYTPICKWLLPKLNRQKPKPESIKWGMPALEAEIEEIKPQIIVCLGKHTFDALTDIKKITHDDAKGAWFYSKRYNCRIYLMEEISKPLFKPHYIEIFRNDAIQIRRMLDIIEGIPVEQVEEHYDVIETVEHLERWVNEMIHERHSLFSVDCEWGGNDHVDGALRSMQLSWLPGYAVYIKFMDDKKNYVFQGATYKEAGAILSRLLDQPKVKYVGHHISADLPWMHTWLGLDWYEKTFMDTEFAYQCIDEEASLGLDDLALKYTDLGKYDIELILWKKDNKLEDGDGYALVPDNILIPYALKDVDTVIRSYPQILDALIKDDLAPYYFSVFNPFVTDVFTNFSLLGLPVDRELMDELRDLYSFCRDTLTESLREEMHTEAFNLLRDKVKDTGCDMSLVASFYKEGKINKAWDVIKDATKDTSQLPEYRTFFDHYIVSKIFNIKSGPHLQRWLYKINKFKPVKSSNGKARGYPSVPWDKVLEKDPEVQKMYIPSADLQSLEILSETYAYPLLHTLIKLNFINNICVSFLKDPVTDLEGNVIQERGIHNSICSDGRVHCQTSTTETGRPRTWKPNVLNWPKYVNKETSIGIGGLLDKLNEDGKLPERFCKYLGVGENIPSLRSCVMAPPGWCFVESDYQTAEIRGLAFISEDEELITIMTQPDPQFGIHNETGKPLRLSYGATSGITEDNQDPKWLTASDSEILKRDLQGNLIHPKADLHWSLAEMMYGVPRESMDKDIHRAAAKVGNFQCVAEGSLILTDKGNVPIEEVTCLHRVWDGVEWVTHDGVVYQGEKNVIEYQGLTATRDHKVWISDGRKIRLDEARKFSYDLVRTQGESGEAQSAEFNNTPIHSKNVRKRLLQSINNMCTLRSEIGKGSSQYGNRQVLEVPMSRWKISRFSFQDAIRKVSEYATEMLPGYACFVKELQRAWHTSGFLVCTGFHSMGVNHLAKLRFQGVGLRPQRKQRQLLERKFTSSAQDVKSSESTRLGKIITKSSRKIQGRKSEGDLFIENMLEYASAGNDVCANNTAAQPKLSYDRQEKGKKSNVVKVYDIINAGPRKRFTCSGVLVSNCAYGASNETLERKIEQDTGKKPEPGTGKRILDALARRQPVATKFLVDLEEAPDKLGFLQAASGRKRHFATHREKGVRYKDKWDAKKLNAGMGREARNFFMQESVAATSARASKWLLNHFIKHNMQARPMVVLYDSVVTLCPMEERYVVAELHEEYMAKRNTWQYGKNLMHYPIDNELLLRWSTKPTKDEKKILYAKA